MFDVQKRQMRERSTSRVLPKATEPFFGALLVVVCLFMAVLLFGAGSILGGLAFSLILIPTAFIVWDEIAGHRKSAQAEE